MNTRSLSSKSNPLIKTFRLVAARARRAPPELVAAEGIRALEEVIEANLVIEAVLFSDQLGTSARARSLRSRLQERGASLFHVPAAILNQLTEVQNSQGIAALVRIPALSLPQVALPDRPLILCAAGIQDPGNLGTLIRTAAAAGAAMVCSLSGTVSARNPKAIRASAGALFRIPVVEQVTAAEFLDYCRRHSLLILSSSAQGGIRYTEIDLTGPCAIVLGNEGAGIDRKAWTGCPVVSIPMASIVESLNVAAAGAVLLFEALRQRSPARAHEGLTSATAAKIASVRTAGNRTNQ